MAAINRAPFNALVDDDGTNTIGTIFGKTEIATVILDPVDAALAASDAPLASPHFTGVPTAPTAAAGNATTQLATTAFVQAPQSPAMTGTPTAPTAAPGTSTTQLATTAFVAAGVAGLAPIASPTFTGVPAAPTAAPGTSTTQLATTAFVQAASSGGTVSRTETGTGNIASLALPVGVGNLVIYMNNATLATIQGIAAGLNNQRLRLITLGAGQVNLSHQDAGAIAAARMINFATSAPTPLAPASGVAEYQYDTATARWRLTEHEQGAMITAPFNAANFAGGGAQTWTLQAGDVLACAYRLDGRRLTIDFNLAATSVGGTANTQLTILNGAYGGFLWTRDSAVLSGTVYAENGGAYTNGFFQVAFSVPNTLFLFKAGLANWTASNNNTTVGGSFSYEVQ